MVSSVEVLRSIGLYSKKMVSIWPYFRVTLIISNNFFKHYRASDPPELHYNISQYNSTDFTEDSKLGPQIIHKYNIKNEGPFPVEEAEMYIMWPYQTLDGKSILNTITLETL